MNHEKLLKLIRDYGEINYAWGRASSAHVPNLTNLINESEKTYSEIEKIITTHNDK